MMRRLLLAGWLLLIAPASVFAQAQEIDVSKVYIGTATITGSGTSVVLSALDVTTTAHVTGITTLDALLNANGSTVTPNVYGYGTPKSLSLGGTAGAVCSGYPTCEALTATFDSALFRQRLKTDTTYETRWYVGEDGGHVNAYDDSGWLPLILEGGPTRVRGGGFHVGGTTGADPGVDNSTFDGYLGKPGYVSQLIGWRITNDGAGDFRHLFTDEMHAKVFTADLEQALAGGQIISKSVAMLGAPFTVPATGAAATLTVKDLPSAAGMAVFESGDWVIVREFSRAAGALTIANACGQVTGYADGDGVQTWTFTRAAAPNGGSVTGGVVIGVDSLALDWGTTGNGLYEVNAIDGLYALNSPYARIYTWASATGPCTSGAITLRTQIGNVRGITGVTGEYGAILGTYAATAGQYIRATSSAVEIHGVNLSMWNGGVQVLKIDRTAPSLAMGVTLPSAFGTGTGLWMGRDVADDTYKWRVGNPAGSRASWDGTTFLIVGNVTATTGSFGGFTIASNTVSSGSGASYVAMSSAGTNAFWAGAEAFASAPFSVTAAGQLKSTLGWIGSFTIGTHLYTSSKTAYNDTNTGVHLGSDGIGIGNNVFTVSSNGTLVATSASITGTVTAGGGDVVLNADGVWLQTGTYQTQNKIKWATSVGGTASAWIGTTDSGVLRAVAGTVILAGDSAAVWVSGASFGPVSADVTLGASGLPWDELYLDAATTTAAYYPLVVSTAAAYKILQKTDGLNGTTTCTNGHVTSITLEYGIVTAITCS